MTALLAAVLVASLLGSLHCVGMCGCFVAFYAAGDGGRGAGRLAAHAVYSGGRLLAYGALGAAAGALGAVLDLAGGLAGLQRIAAVVAGAAMIGWGVVALLRLYGLRLGPRFVAAGAVARLVRGGLARVGGRPPVVRALAVGLLSGALPCGWLWVFLVTAAGTGGPLAGMAVMTAFWAGTVPALVALGLGAQLAAAPLRRHAPSLTAVLMVVLGILAIVSRPASVTAAIELHAPSPATAAERLGELDHRELPCCQD